MQIITVTQKGQIVIPAEMRRKLNIKKGTKLTVQMKDNGLYLSQGGENAISRMRGSLKADEPVTEYLLRERREEYAAMEKKWKK